MRKFLSAFLCCYLSASSFGSNYLFHGDSESLEKPKVVVTKRDINNDKKIDYICVSIYQFNILRNITAEDTNYDGRYDRFTDEFNGIDYFKRLIVEDTDYDGCPDKITNRFRRFGKGLLVDYNDECYDLWADKWTDVSKKYYMPSDNKVKFILERIEEIEKMIGDVK